ncbi:uncharacterized protein LTR77_001770 [Saxophila tyrrhenica]|uniref:Uncharacterized protein n=1 Tax=Saxophila tyrrhenica TaxID=1690608 RepID=A0AAV9PLD5_9PEZI|nr:hypothetical protein LTR77_001770 [Saxophila tyrrhenica]
MSERSSQVLKRKIQTETTLAERGLKKLAIDASQPSQKPMRARGVLQRRVHQISAERSPYALMSDERHSGRCTRKLKSLEELEDKPEYLADLFSSTHDLMTQNWTTLRIYTTIEHVSGNKFKHCYQKFERSQIVGIFTELCCEYDAAVAKLHRTGFTVVENWSSFAQELLRCGEDADVGESKVVEIKPAEPHRTLALLGCEGVRAVEHRLHTQWVEADDADDLELDNKLDMSHEPDTSEGREEDDWDKMDID